MSGGHGAQPAFEYINEVSDSDFRPGGIASDGLDDRQRVLDAMIKSPQQQLLPTLPLLALTDIASDLRRADDCSRDRGSAIP